MALRALLFSTIATLLATGLPLAAGDADLERAVRAAYTGAAAYAAAHGNYFARDGVFAPLRDAVAAELVTQGLASVVVPDKPFADLAAAQRCAWAPVTQLRIAINLYGDGVSLVAVTNARLFSYHYDPHEAAEIVVAPAADCIKG